MCKAFSCIITKSKKVYWKAGLDSHSDILKKFEKKDIELIDNKLPPKNTFARIEITPDNEDYINPSPWSLKIDENIIPEWWNKTFEKPCFSAFEKWKKKVYTFNIDEAKNPINPFKIKAVVTENEIELAKQFYSVRLSIRNSVKNSVQTSIRDSVKNSVQTSIRDSVGVSVLDFVWTSIRDSVGVSVRYSVRVSVGYSIGETIWISIVAYIGSLFSINKWKYIKHKKGEYPYQSAVDLWKKGLVYIEYGGRIRLFGSPFGNGKCKELWSKSINNN